MSTHLIVILVSGLIGIATFVLPYFLKDRMITMPMIFVLLGFILFSLPIDLPIIDPDNNRIDRKILEYITEFIVILSLSAIGLKIDRKPSFKNWKVATHMLGILMPLTILALTLLGYFILGLTLASAILLGAVLSPTDPVLADNVQVRPPNSGDEHPVRFSLTVEAGLNDGLAFPFVYLAILIEKQGLSIETIAGWLTYEVGYKIIMGCLIGFIIGKVLSHLFFRLATKMDHKNITDINEGLFLIGATLLCYGLTEWIGGYGFLAVFVSAVVARQHKNDHPLHEQTYKSINQVEQALLYVFLFVFGGLLATTDFTDFSYYHILIGMILIVVIRPLLGFVSLTGTDLTIRDKWIVSILGIRGIGSIYYIAFAHNELPNFSQIDDVWYVVSCTIVLSLLIHGLSANRLISKVEK